jgi:hypothetical protein
VLIWYIWYRKLFLVLISCTEKSGNPGGGSLECTIIEPRTIERIYFDKQEVKKTEESKIKTKKQELIVNDLLVCNYVCKSIE